MLKRLIPKPGAPVAAILACAIGATAYGEQTDAEKKKAEAAAEYLKAHGWSVQGPAQAKKTEAQKKKAEAAEEAAKKAADAERKLHEPFFWRFDEAYREQLGTPCYVPAPPPSPDGKSDDKSAPPVTACRRGLPAPFDSPPYPMGEWQMGGTDTIGDPNTIDPGPLMQALYDGPSGEIWKNSKIMIRGWEDFSGNISSSRNSATGQSNNFPEIYDERANRIEQNQFVLFVERTADECQTDHMDWGFRASAIYGLDYRYMISRGFLDRQLLVHNNFNGFDMPMMYFNLYIPWIAQGMNIRIGRIISEADIEAQLAPDNPMSSHSLLYGFDPYTDWGVFTTTKLNKNWTIQLGIDAGGDVAPWQADPGRQATGDVMFQYVSDDNKFSFYGGANQFNRGNFGYNNLQQFVGTFSYKFNEWCWTSHETWYMFMRDVTTAPTSSVPFQNGFYPINPGYAAEFATLNYTFFRLAAGTFLTIRNEFFNDMDGSRTGFIAKYYETSMGITWWPDKLVTVRPEIRWERAFGGATPYDDGTRKSQLTLQCDVIIHF